MNVAALMYHDIVADGSWNDSGFPGGAAASYKFDEAEFAHHVDALAASGLVFPAFPASSPPGTDTCLLTFDDGGSSALAIARMLDARGMVGHFFVTTGRIGQRGFVNMADIKALAASGHVLGSHSHTHPREISALDDESLESEWRTSVDRLAQLTGAAPKLGSVPGGFYSPRVATAAAAAGIRWLFTSEPTTRAHMVDECHVLGRFPLWRDMTPDMAVALARGLGLARERQWLAWNFKKPLKRWARPLYRVARARLLGD